MSDNSAQAIDHSIPTPSTSTLSTTCSLTLKGRDYVHEPPVAMSFWDFVDSSEHGFLEFMRAVVRKSDEEWHDYSLRINAKSHSLLVPDDGFIISTFVRFLTKFELVRRERCLSCDLDNPVSQACLLRETEFNRCWLDAKGRPMFVVTPTKHYERLSDLSHAELLAFFKDARDLLLTELCTCIEDAAKLQNEPQRSSRKAKSRRKGRRKNGRRSPRGRHNDSEAPCVNSSYHDASSNHVSSCEEKSAQGDTGHDRSSHNPQKAGKRSDHDHLHSQKNKHISRKRLASGQVMLLGSNGIAAKSDSKHSSGAEHRHTFAGCPSARYTRITINHGLCRNLEHLHMKITVPQPVFKRWVRRWSPERVKKQHDLMKRLSKEPELTELVGGMGAFRGEKFFKQAQKQSR